MKNFRVTTFLLLLCFSARAEILPPRPATQAEVTAGTDGVHPVTPKTLAGAAIGGGPTNGLTQAQVKALLESGTNSPNFNLESATNHSGGGSGLTNLVHGNAVLPGANINVAAAQRPTDGGTNYTPSLADPISVNQGNYVNITTTNFYSVTNDLNGITLIDFASGSFATIKLSGNLTLTGVSNLVSGVSNDKIIEVIPNGADRTIPTPAGFRAGRYNTGVVTNGTIVLFWAHVHPGVCSNWYQLDAL